MIVGDACAVDRDAENRLTGGPDSGIGWTSGLIRCDPGRMSHAIDRTASYDAVPSRVRGRALVLVSRRHVDLGRISSAVCRA